LDPAITVTDVIGNADATLAGVAITDDAEPIVVSAEAVPDPAGVEEVTVTIVFSEAMKTDVSPTVVVSNLVGDDYVVAQSTYVGTTWTGTFTLLDSNEDATGNIDVSLAQDLATNVMDAAPAAGTLDVDTLNPTLNSIAWTDVDVSTDISGTDTLVLTFSEAMDITTLTTADPVALATDLGLSAGIFGATGFDAAWTPGNIILTITLGTETDILSGATLDPAITVTDVIGNADATLAGVAITDDAEPIVVSAEAVPDPAGSGVATITIVFSELMDTTTAPTVRVTGLAASPYTVNQSTYIGDTWIGTFTVLDNDEDATATITVSGAKDVATNTMITDNNAGTFGVDTIAPVVSNINVDKPAYRATQDPTVLVTIIEDDTAETVKVNGSDATETGTAGTWTYEFAHGGIVGRYSLSVDATDVIGNTVRYFGSYDVVVNSAPDAPVIAITAPAAGDTISETYNVIFTTNDATTTDAYISIDGATTWVAATTNANPGTYSLDTTALANGSHTLRVKDTVNTVTGYSDYITFIVINSEAEAPTVVAQSPEGDVEEDWDGPIYIDFSEWMKPSTLNDTTIKICQGSSSTPSETCLDDLVILPTASSTGQTRAIISNDISLDYDATYWIVVSTGTTDMADNPLNQADQDHEGAYWGRFTMGPAPEEPEVDLSIDNITLTNIGETNGEWNDDGSAGDAYEWVIRVTLPADEPPLLAFQFDDWTNGLDTADNMRYWSEEIEVGEVGSAGDPMSITVANSYVDGDIEITGDSDTWESGIQTNIHVQLQIPGDTPAGSHSTSFKVRSGGAI